MIKVINGKGAYGHSLIIKTEKPVKNGCDTQFVY
jgi:hypothetical protein